MKKFFSALMLLTLLVTAGVFFDSCKASNYDTDESEIDAELNDFGETDGEHTDICPGTDNENGWGEYITVE